MSEFTRELDGRSPNRDEIDRILADARRMRAEVMRNAAVRLWAVLQRSVTRRHAGQAPRHA